MIDRATKHVQLASTSTSPSFSTSTSAAYASYATYASHAPWSRSGPFPSAQLRAPNLCQRVGDHVGARRAAR